MRGMQSRGGGGLETGGDPFSTKQSGSELCPSGLHMGSIQAKGSETPEGNLQPMKGTKGNAHRQKKGL